MSKGKRNLGQGKFHYFDYETFCRDFKDTKWCSPEFEEVLDPAFESVLSLSMIQMVNHIITLL
jgi:hypothetical protein